MTARNILAILWLSLVGCQPAKTVTPVAEVSKASATEKPPAGEQIPRAEYINWNRFPLGTHVVRVRQTTNQHGTVVVTTREKLVEKNEQKVVVESQIDVQRPNEKLEQNDSMTHEFMASFALPPGMNAHQFLLPSVNAKKVGSEKVPIEGQEYEADIYQWEDGSEAGPIQCKLWRSEQFPGRFIKQEQLNAGAKFSSIETISHVEIPDAQH